MVPFCETMRDWVGDSNEEIALTSRATRDGFRRDASCTKDGPETFSLARVASGLESEHGGDSVVGVYHHSPWSKAAGTQQTILEDTSCSCSKMIFPPRTKGLLAKMWHPTPGYVCGALQHVIM